MNPTTLKELYEEVRERLTKAAMPQSDSQARRLLAQLLRLSFYEPLLHPSKIISEEACEKVHQATRRLLLGEPLEYIAGYTIFDGWELKVNASVLIPRPETEELACLVAKRVQARTSSSSLPLQALDLATGSGCLAIALKKRLIEWKWQGSDLSEQALEVAKENASRLGVCVEFRKGSWLDPWKEKRAPWGFDLVVSNPPYIGEEEKELISASAWEYEPHLALLDGGDGLSVYRLLARELPLLLNNKALVALEIGWKQGEKIKEIFESEGWGKGVVACDLSGHPRFFFIER